MLYRHALGEVIRELRTEQQKTLRQISQKSCVALGYLSEIERGHKEASSEIVGEIARSLNYETHELILLVGYRLGGLDKAPNTASELVDEYADLIGQN
jgi:transcriptional regulator with XRE-family HTH domain